MVAAHARSARRASSLLAPVLLIVLVAPARAGGWPHAGRGAALDPGVSPHRGPYDAAIPGILPGPPRHGPDRGPRQHGLRRDGTPYVRTGLHRYPCFGGYIPAAPYDDCLYRTGPHPWQR